LEPLWTANLPSSTSVRPPCATAEENFVLSGLEQLINVIANSEKNAVITPRFIVSPFELTKTLAVRNELGNKGAASAYANDSGDV
jgi:hypothetical protein